MPKNIAVIGTLFVDYKGFSHSPYDAKGRNLGHVEIVAGGVGRNVAVNLAHLNIATHLISTVDDDATGKEITQKIQLAGVNIAGLKKVAHQGMGKWLAVMNQNGDLVGSISQMPDISLIEKEITPLLPKVLTNADALALEIDLGLSLIQNIIEQANKQQCPIYALPGNLSVVGQNLHLLKHLECFVCNEVEAETLTGIQNLNSPESMLQAIKEFAHIQQIKNLVVTMGAQGAVYVDEKGNSGHQPAENIVVVDTSGAGDSFFSGVSAAMVQGQSLAQAVSFGSKVAAIVIEQTESDCSAKKQEIQQLLIEENLMIQKFHSNYIISTY